MKISDSITCEAFTRAISRLEQPSPDLQMQIDSLRQKLTSPDFLSISEDTARDIRVLVSQYPRLQQIYDREIDFLEREYGNGDRAKSIAASFDDSCLTPKNSTQSRTADFWEKVDRIMIMAAGGAFIGSLIAQVPGAIFGCLMTAAYGFYIGFIKPRQTRRGRNV
jgi:hypothetical protein